MATAAYRPHAVLIPSASCHTLVRRRDSGQESQPFPVLLRKPNQALCLFRLHSYLLAKVFDDLGMERDGLPSQLVELLRSHGISCHSNYRGEDSILALVACNHLEGEGAVCRGVTRRRQYGSGEGHGGPIDGHR